MSRVLALKYRPKRFKDLIGQESISQTLSLGLKSDKLSHAYLFSGLRGSGKTSTARIFAKALVCEKAPVDEPCGICAGCLSAEEGRHMDIVEMDAASNRGIDDIRQLIESTKYKPSVAKHKIYIIDEVHMLSTPAFNALLKTLEEPPSYVNFILATTDPVKLPATILSRTIHFRFKKINHFDVVEHLKHILGQENISFEEEALSIIARNGSGSLRDTLTLLDQAIVFSKGFVSQASVVELLGAVNPDKIKELFEYILGKNRDEALLLLKEFEDYEAENILNEIVEFLKTAIESKHKKISIFALERFFRIAINAKELLFIGADGGFVLTLTVLKMIEASEIEDIDSLIAKYESEVDFSKQEEESIAVTKDEEIVLQKKPITKERWGKLIDGVFERSYEIGNVFSKNISFISYENGVLTWSSSAEGEDKDMLRKYYSQIRHIVQDVYGVSVEIVVQKSEAVAIESSIQKETIEDVSPKESKHEEMPADSIPNISIESDEDEEQEYIQEGPGLFDDDQTTENKTLDEEAAELSLLKHPLVEKTKEVFGLTDNNISVL
jgi:DNA polymerase III subunit gamma/tau